MGRKFSSCYLASVARRGVGVEAGWAWRLRKSGWAGVGDSLFPRGPCPHLPWRALDSALGVTFLSFSPRPFPAGENFWLIRQRQPGQPDNVHGFSGRHLFEPNHVANVSYLQGRRKERCFRKFKVVVMEHGVQTGGFFAGRGALVSPY